MAPLAWLHSERAPPTADIALGFTRLTPPPAGTARDLLGPLRFEGAWKLDSRHRLFGGYSALLALDDGEFLAISDRGVYLQFSPPGTPQRPQVIETVFSRQVKGKVNRDFEAATRDPETGTFWTALENANIIARQHFAGPRLRLSGLAAPEAMAGWEGNAGPEAMVRLRDGRFVVLREAALNSGAETGHDALLFARDPVDDRKAARFTAQGPAGYSPTDMAQLPDGRVLVLFRKLLWPFPARFDGLLALGNPEAIEPGKDWHLLPVARLSEPLPSDNYEGLAIVPEAQSDRVILWLISDDNSSAFQRTLLLKLSLDPADLPEPGEDRASKKARGDAARPSPQPE